jgi:hypothetical protein
VADELGTWDVELTIWSDAAGSRLGGKDRSCGGAKEHQCFEAPHCKMVVEWSGEMAFKSAVGMVKLRLDDILLPDGFLVRA